MKETPIELARRILGEREMCEAREVDVENGRILRCRKSHYDDPIGEPIVHHDDVYGDWRE